jgi:hypothetical protein
MIMPNYHKQLSLFQQNKRSFVVLSRAYIGDRQPLAASLRLPIWICSEPSRFPRRRNSALSGQLEKRAELQFFRRGMQVSAPRRKCGHCRGRHPATMERRGAEAPGTWERVVVSVSSLSGPLLGQKSWGGGGKAPKRVMKARKPLSGEPPFLALIPRAKRLSKKCTKRFKIALVGIRKCL